MHYEKKILARLADIVKALDGTVQTYSNVFMSYVGAPTHLNHFIFSYFPEIKVTLIFPIWSLSRYIDEMCFWPFYVYG